MLIVKLRKQLKEIEALATNPHWTTDRRWKIAERVKEAQQTLDNLEEAVVKLTTES